MKQLLLVFGVALFIGGTFIFIGGISWDNPAIWLFGVVVYKQTVALIGIVLAMLGGGMIGWSRNSRK